MHLSWGVGYIIIQKISREFFGGVLKRGQIAVRKPLIGASRRLNYARAPRWAHDDSTTLYPTHCWINYGIKKAPKCARHWGLKMFEVLLGFSIGRNAEREPRFVFGYFLPDFIYNGLQMAGERLVDVSAVAEYHHIVH